jgi:hypothetical protein
MRKIICSADRTCKLKEMNNTGIGPEEDNYVVPMKTSKSLVGFGKVKSSRRKRRRSKPVPNKSRKSATRRVSRKKKGKANTRKKPVRRKARK